MAVLIDGATECISIADNAKWSFTPVSQDRAATCWYKTSSAPNAHTEYQIIFHLDQEFGNKLQCLLFNNAGASWLIVFMQNSEWSPFGYFYTLWTPSVDTWYHLVFNLGANSACGIYIDGVSQGLTYVNWVNSTALNPSMIRVSDGIGIYDDESISHLAFWNAKLTQSEIDLIRWNPDWCMGHTKLLAYFPLDEGSGTTARDLSASSGQTVTNGTLTNNPTWVDGPPIAKQSANLLVEYVAAGGGRTTKNPRAFPLGINYGTLRM